ncbi:MAG: DUF1232 domain-containing protein [Oscillochloris sp.]|nr:DUF1232 domain-containing protein [Oscillochloris sp.]
MPAELRKQTQALKREVTALWLAAKHPQTPWPLKLLAGLVVAYALSPIDLIPDVVPLLGYLDDLLLVPLGIVLLLRLLPADILNECRAQAATLERRPPSMIGAVLVIGLWITAALLGLFWLRHLLQYPLQEP